MKLLNSFSPVMLPDVWNGEHVYFCRIAFEMAKQLLVKYGVESYIKYQGLANILTNEFEQDIDCNPARVQLRPGEQVLVALYYGITRLEDNDIELPADGHLVFFLVLPFARPDFGEFTPRRRVDQIPGDESESVSLEE
tara:strand:+ start:391 stop:804 length:414 start_codon:yes stop_codon:yes gene_type:complete